jgi:predicted N-formylglutamate amidohydrolase
VLAIHSMTPTMRASRPWQIAVCWDTDHRLSAPMLDALRAHSGIVVGITGLIA